MKFPPTPRGPALLALNLLSSAAVLVLSGCATVPPGWTPEASAAAANPTAAEALVPVAAAPTVAAALQAPLATPATAVAPALALATPAAPALPSASPVPDEAHDAPDAIALIAQGVPLPRSSISAVPVPAQIDEESGRDVADMPSDPLEPQAPVNLGADRARDDLWGRVRGRFALPDLQGELVRDHERWYSARPEYVRRMTERGSRYLYHVMQEVERRRMPAELALLPFIESAFNPQAMSTAKASGMWQFMPATGRDYELKQNIFRDDRRDVLASTRAALDYLGRLHAMFNDWHLALAAYNWGEGNVQRAIARNQRAGLPTGYEDLRMPAETRHYVPKLQAVKNIVSQPENFGISLLPLQNHPYFLSVSLRRDIDTALAARLAGLSLDEFKTLNPQLNKPVILAAGTPQVLLPYDNADRFKTQLDAYRGPLATWTAWVVPRTLKVSEAARFTGMDEAQLREINRIPPRMVVKAGSTLLVPRDTRRTADVPEHVADNAQMALAPEASPLRKRKITARKGDTLASLAARHRVSVAQLGQWNRLSTGSRLQAGQSLVLFQAPTSAKARGAARPAGNAKVTKTAKVRSASAPRKAVAERRLKVASARP